MSILSARRPPCVALPEDSGRRPGRDREVLDGLRAFGAGLPLVSPRIPQCSASSSRGHGLGRDGGSPVGGAASSASPRGGRQSVPCRLGATCRRFVKSGAVACAFSHWGGGARRREQRTPCRGLQLNCTQQEAAVPPASRPWAFASSAVLTGTLRRELGRQRLWRPPCGRCLWLGHWQPR